MTETRKYGLYEVHRVKCTGCHGYGRHASDCLNKRTKLVVYKRAECCRELAFPHTAAVRIFQTHLLSYALGATQEYCLRPVRDPN